MILAVIVEYAAGNSVGVQPALPDHRPPAYVNEDFSQANNLAEKNPAKLKELQDAPSSTKLSGLRVNAQDLSARVAGWLRSSTANQEWPCSSGNESSPYLPEIVYTECGRQKENHQQGRSDSRVIAEQDAQSSQGEKDPRRIDRTFIFMNLTFRLGKAENVKAI